MRSEDIASLAQVRISCLPLLPSVHSWK